MKHLTSLFASVVAHVRVHGEHSLQLLLIFRILSYYVSLYCLMVRCLSLNCTFKQGLRDWGKAPVLGGPRHCGLTL